MSINISSSRLNKYANKMKAWQQWVENETRKKEKDSEAKKVDDQCEEMEVGKWKDKHIGQKERGENRRHFEAAFGAAENGSPSGAAAMCTRTRTSQPVCMVMNRMPLSTLNASIRFLLPGAFLSFSPSTPFHNKPHGYLPRFPVFSFVNVSVSVCVCVLFAVVLPGAQKEKTSRPGNWKRPTSLLSPVYMATLDNWQKWWKRKCSKKHCKKKA